MQRPEVTKIAGARAVAVVGRERIASPSTVPTTVTSPVHDVEHLDHDVAASGGVSPFRSVPPSGPAERGVDGRRAARTRP